jgi:membrane associated rhomboid family serine protease
MLLLVPMGADQEAPRAPRATLALIVVNLVVFAWTARLDGASTAAREQELQRVAEWTLRVAEADAPGLTQRAAGRGSALVFLDSDGLWRREIESAELRQRLEDCLEDYRRLRSEHPLYAWGFIPADVSLGRLLAHQFLHVDALHVGLNMVFLWTAGGLVELTLGAALFVPAYLLGGMAAAFAHAAFNPGSSEPAVGASGAVSAAMGMVAVLHGRQPLRLALVVMLAAAPRILFLSWPAWVLLGLWLLEQVFFASFGLSSLGVAFWAHIGGFVFGMLLALAVARWSGVSDTGGSG